MRIRAWLLAVCSLGATWVFFLEYLPPFQAVGIHGDLPGYHFPLVNYAWQELRQGRIPLWDPVIYSGISYTGITQEGLFYPPNWLLFGAAAAGRGMTLKSVEVLLMLHLWAGFLFCLWWLRGRLESGPAAFVGAAAFALGGMPLAQLQHVGVVSSYVWIPLALGAVDRARREDSMRPYLLVALAGAMSFLAGYPPTFLAFCLCTGCWVLAGRRALRHAVSCAAALGFSMLLAAVQLLPTMQANLTRMPERSYGGGLPHGAMTYLLLSLPNYFDSARPASGVQAWGDCFYLGAAAVAGLLAAAAMMIRERWLGTLAAPAATLAVAVALIENPLGLVDAAVSLFPMLAGVLREYNLLPCVTVACCCLAAHGIAELQRLGSMRLPVWGVWLVVALAGAWSVRLLWLWIPGGVEFASGWATGLDALGGISLAGALSAGMAVCRLKHVRAAALVVLTLAELKSFGTNRRFNAEAGHTDKRLRALRDMRTGGEAMAGMEQSVFERLRGDRAYRVVLVDGLQPLELHYYGLATPQGFEASLPARYREKVASYVPWRTNRLFEPAVGDERFLREFGVRYAICREGGSGEQGLKGLAHWRALGSAGHFFRVYEYAGAVPAYRFGGTVTVQQWVPGWRLFEVASEAGGEFELLEQNLPGWEARVDGAEAGTGDGIWMRVKVPAGSHRVEYVYEPRDVMVGAWVSAAALAALIAAGAYSGRSGTALSLARL